MGAIPSDVCAEELDDDAAVAAADDDYIDDRAAEEELLAKEQLVRAGTGTGTGRAVYRTSSVARASECIFLTALTMVL